MKTEQLTRSPQPESPKRLFQVLREREQYQHQVIAKGMKDAGFEVRRIVRQPYHPVWTVYLCSRFMPLLQVDSVKHKVAAMLTRLGVKCRPSEVEASIKGDRVKVSFIYQPEAFGMFPPGMPGILSIHELREHWLPTVMEPCEDVAE